MGAQNVVVTSLQLKGRDSYIDLIAVGKSVGGGRFYHMAMPRQQGKYSGCGDLSCALLLSWITR